MNGGTPSFVMPLESVVSLAFVMIGLLFLMWIIALIRIRRLNKRLKAFVKDTGVVNLQDVIEKLHERTEVAATKLEHLRKNSDLMMQKTERMVSNVGLTRYNAFGEGSGELSFSVAIVNEKQDGVVISALNSRHESRVYAKMVKSGASAIALTPEEKEVIVQATTGNR